MAIIASIILLCLSSWATGSAPATDLVALSPTTWDEYAPAGKEVDAIYGDFVLRNEQLVAVIGNPIDGRDANMGVRGVGGCIIDLTRRDSQSDQLSAHYPVSRQFRLRFAGVETKASSIYETADLSSVFIRADEITLRLEAAPADGNPDVVQRYTLRNGWSHILVETVYTNPTDKPIECGISDSIRADRSLDQRTPEIIPDGRGPLFWLYDPWFGQAYGMVVEGAELHYQTGSGRTRGSAVQYLSDGRSSHTLQPGESLRVTRRLFPGRNLLEVRAIANELLGTSQKRVTIAVTDKSGDPIPDSAVTLSKGSERYGWGRTGANGELTASIPSGSYEVTVAAMGRTTQNLQVDASANDAYTIVLDEPGHFRARIVDESGAAIAAKLQFRGQNETPDPDFGPDSGEHKLHNVYYTHNGSFRQPLAPGRYEVIVSHGPEYDAVFTQVEITRGKETALEATLVRSVDTSGWVSSDFHSHSTPSGDNTSSQLGRVLNLLSEHIEFAPCTEHNRISTYIPHLESLGVADQMATCSGIELTRSPGSVNHQNAFPLILRPHLQDGGGPRTESNPESQIRTLAFWDNRSEKLVQQNHPHIGRILEDHNGDGEPDAGYAQMFDFMDVIEVHPAIKILDTDAAGATRIGSWLHLINRGLRIPGVINTDAHGNFHGSGFRRNYLKSSSDDPAKIQTLQMVQSAENGNLIMTTGPYLEVSMETAGGDEVAIPGNDFEAIGGKAQLKVRVQCPNWFDIDRVQVFLNGSPDKALNYTRQQNPTAFQSATVRFERTLSLQLQHDTHVVVVAAGETTTLGPVMGPNHEEDRPVAVSNPIFVDVDGGGFELPESVMSAAADIHNTGGLSRILSELSSQNKSGVYRIQLSQGPDAILGACYLPRAGNGSWHLLVPGDYFRSDVKNIAWDGNRFDAMTRFTGEGACKISGEIDLEEGLITGVLESGEVKLPFQGSIARNVQ